MTLCGLLFHFRVVHKVTLVVFRHQLHDLPRPHARQALANVSSAQIRRTFPKAWDFIANPAGRVVWHNGHRTQKGNRFLLPRAIQIRPPNSLYMERAAPPPSFPPIRIVHTIQSCPVFDPLRMLFYTVVCRSQLPAEVRLPRAKRSNVRSPPICSMFSGPE
jgi:hypothetical protein